MDGNREQIKYLAEKYTLSLVVLFGSQATGKTHKGSDYDIAYLSERVLSFTEESRLIIDLMPVFQTSAIDLVNIHNAPPLLLKQIAEKCVVLYERDSQLFSRFRVYAYKRYMEAQHLFRMRSKSLNSFLNRIPLSTP